MMDVFDSTRIRGVHCCVPSRKINNEYFENTFTKDQIDDVVRMIGVENRYWVDSDVSTGDLCISAAKTLLEKIKWNSKSIDALIFITQTPDYILPGTSARIHKKLNLDPSCKAFDVNLGCSGYVYGLWLASCLIQSGAAKRVLLLAGETPSKIVDKKDKSTVLLFGDAGSATAIDFIEDHSLESCYILGTNGEGFNNLIIPTGAFGNYQISEDDRLLDKNPSCLFMDGASVFNFTLTEVPKLYETLIAKYDHSHDSLDGVLMHQANLFMLNHLKKRCKISDQIFKSNIKEFGNTSSCSIPLLICSELKENSKDKDLTLALLGFGVGYSWAGGIIRLEKSIHIDLEFYD